MKKTIFFDTNTNEIKFDGNNLDVVEIFSFKDKQLVKNISKFISKNEKFTIQVNDVDDEKIVDLEYALKAIAISESKNQYEFIYDAICRRLDEKFAKENYCKFENDRCIAQRENKTAHEIMGCCYEFEYSRVMRNPIDKGLCHFMQNKKCTQSCITCKLFTCRYLRKLGIKFALEDFWPLDTFFNKKQKNILENSFFKSKEEILDNLLKAK